MVENPNIIDMIGRKFGLLIVIARANTNKYGTVRWKCLCKCGEIRVIDGTALRAGRNKGCGCQSAVKFIHGKYKSRTYRIWAGIINRCSPTSKGKSRKLYYDKGIRVCDEWKDARDFCK